MADKSRGVSFDADALAAANEEPTLTLAGYVYHGRLLSAPEWFLWRDRALALYARATSAPATVPEAEELALYQAFFKDVFPRRRFRFWAPDPFIFAQINGRKALIMSDLELDRAKAEAKVDEVLPLGKKGTVEAVDLLFKERGVKEVRVPSSFPVALADPLREKGYTLRVAKDPFFL